MQDLVTYYDEAGRPCQNFKGVVYRLYPTDKYFRSSAKRWARLHVAVWSYVNNRKPPKGYHVHHVDENKLNNQPTNLKLVRAGKHLSDHMRKSYRENPQPFMERMERAQKAAAKWSHTVEGLKFRKQHAIKVLGPWIEHLHKKEVSKKCEVCGNEYITTNLASVQSRFCSNNCKSEFRRQSGVDNIEKICTVCGGSFSANKYSKKHKCDRCVPPRYLNRAKKYR